MFRFPLVRLTLFFAIGISAQKFFDADLMLSCCLCFACAVVSTLLLFVKSSVPKWTVDCCFYLTFAFLGGFCLEAHDASNAKGHYLKLVEQPKKLAIRLELREKLKPSKQFQKYICAIDRIGNGYCEGKVLLHLPRQAVNGALPIGQIIAVSAQTYPFKPPLNPDQFDYGAYMQHKNVFARIYTDSIIKCGIDKNIWYWADRFRSRVLSNASNGFSPREFAVFGALMLGQQQEIDIDIIRNYQYSGAVHILSVSGLHIGFLMMVLEFSLKILPNSKYWNLIKLITILLCLWGFAVVAGLSASVVRSVTMFSFVAIGMHLKRGSNIFNTLAASMLLILILVPQFLFDVGFQLSYLALFFIVWLKPIFDKISMPRNAVLKYLWNIVAVSFAAQIGTLPLSLYYFHQFPGLFFITNLVAIPLLAIIMVIGIFTLVWACFSNIPFWLGGLTSKSIELLDFLIEKIATYDAFVFKGIWFSVLAMVLSYLLIVVWVSFFKKPTVELILCGLASILVLQSVYLIFQISSEQKNELVVFQSKRNSFITDRTGRNAHVYFKGKDKSVGAFAFGTYLVQNRLRPQTQQWKNVFCKGGKKMLVIDSSKVFIASVKPDIILLTDSPKLNLDRVLSKCRPALVVADGSNFNSIIKRWEKSCQKQKIPFHATAEKGSYILKDSP